MNSLFPMAVHPLPKINIIASIPSSCVQKTNITASVLRNCVHKVYITASITNDTNFFRVPNFSVDFDLFRFICFFLMLLSMLYRSYHDG